jgi:CRISPR-associated protein Cas2
MFYLIAYDIAEPKRLRQVAKLTEAYGLRVQRSVFECSISESRLDSLLREVKGLMERREDKLQVYRLCKHCRHRFERRDPDQITEEPEVYIC